MAANSETVTYDQLFSLVGRTRRDRVSDNIGNSQPTLDLFHAAGQVEVEAGGESIEERLLYAYQDAEWMSDRQSVNTADKEGVTTALFPWRYCVAPVNISKTDELKMANNKDSRIDFAESKMIQARQGLRTTINTAMNGAQSGKSMLGNQDLVRDSVSTGTLGGLDLSVAGNSWFRNNAYTTSTTFLTQTSADIFNGWDAVGAQYEAASDINEEVTHIAAGSTLYNKMLSSLEAKGYVRFDTRDKAALGAGGQRVGSGPAFRGATIFKDRAIAASHIYLYNINVMKLKIQRGANFAKTPFVMADATGVLAKVCFYIVGIQFVSTNPRRTAVLTAVS